MNKANQANGNQKLEKFVLALFSVFVLFSGIAWLGIKKIKFKKIEIILLVSSILFLFFMMTYADYAYLKWLHYFIPDYFTDSVLNFLRKFPHGWHFCFIAFGTLYFVGVIFGFKDHLRRQKMQKGLDSIGLSNAKGEAPKVIREIEIDDNKSKLLISCYGVGIDRFDSKKSDLESALGRIIESISVSEDRKTVSVNMCKRELRKSISFYEACQNIKRPYQFLVGDSANGVLAADLRELPHLLIAGSTGGGKSVFFRAVLVALLKYSTKIQVYLIDLKRGVEVKEFAQLPNVEVAKDEIEAVQMLETIRNEMQKRFEYMEKHEIKLIDPDKHNFDLIVVGIDEASVLFGKTSISKAKAEIVSKARELTDEIAKLSRAAGIHLIIATQKAVKESLDTKVLENLNGKMVFKMSTHAGSNTALGNSRAYSLPDIKGRGIWAGGNRFIEVQAPYLSEKELEDECLMLAESMEKDGLKNHKPMLNFKKMKSANKNLLASGEISQNAESD